MKRIQIHVGDEQLKRLRKMSKPLNCSVASLIRHAIDGYVQRHSGLYVGRERVGYRKRVEQQFAHVEAILSQEEKRRK